MKPFASLVVTAMAFGLAACNPGTGAQAQTSPVAEAVRLVDQPRLSADIEAMPRLTGDSPAIARINAELDQIDAQAVRDAAECVETAGDGPGGGWSRWITQPMTGPEYVTLSAQFEYYCGGAYPMNAQTAVTYDLTTGARVDWPALLPALELIQDEASPDMPAGHVYSLRSPQLEALYARLMIADATAANGEPIDAEWLAQCRDVWKPEEDEDLAQTFYLWADAEHGGVAISLDYPHAVQACGGPTYLSGAELGATGADERLIEALTAARSAGRWSSHEDEAAAE